MSFTKAVLSGTAIVSLSAIVGRAIGFVSAPVLTRLLGPEAYGTMALIGTLVNLSATIALFGRELGYSRFGLQGDADARFQVEVYLWRSIIVTAASIALVVGASWAWFFRGSATNAQFFGIYLTLATMLAPILSMASVRSRLRGQYGRIAVASLVAAVVSTAVSIWWALCVSSGAWALAVGLLMATVVNLAILGTPGPRHLLKASGLNPERRGSVLRLGLSSVVTAPIYWAVMSLDRWFLNASAGQTEVGVYAFAAQFGLLGVLINNGVTTTWLSEAARAFEAHGENAMESIGANCRRLMTGLLIAWMAVSAGGGDMLRLLSPVSFHHGAAVIPWVAAGVMFYGVSWLFVASLFIRGRMRFMTAAWAVGGTIGLILYAMLAPRFGSIGVAIGQAIAFATIALVTWIASSRVLAMPLPYLRIVIGGVVALGTVCAMSPQWLHGPVQSLMVKAPAGMVAVVVILAIMSPDLLKYGSVRVGRYLLARKGDNKGMKT